MDDAHSPRPRRPSAVEDRLQRLEVQASRWHREALRWRLLLLALLIFGGIIAACGCR